MLKIMISYVKVAAVTVAFMLASTGSVFADSLTVDITTGALVINDSRTDARVLLSFDLPSELSGTELVFAELLIPLTSMIPDSTALAIYCHPLQIAWSEDEVTWEDLGDSLTSEVISEDGTLYATSEEGDQGAYFDLTSVVRTWMDGEMQNNGLLLFCDAERLPRFQFNRGRDLPTPQMKFTYTH